MVLVIVVKVPHSRIVAALLVFVDSSTSSSGSSPYSSRSAEQSVTRTTESVTRTAESETSYDSETHHDRKLDASFGNQKP